MSTIVADVAVGLNEDQIKGLKKGQRFLLNYNATDHSFTAEVSFVKKTSGKNCCLVKIERIIGYTGNLGFVVGDSTPVHFNELMPMQ